MNYYGTDQYKEYVKKLDEQVFSKTKFREPDRVKELESGYCIKFYFYEDKDNCKPGYAPASGEICRLYHNGRMVFEWKNKYEKTRMAKIIHHADGNSYLVFTEDLYGYSVLNLDTLDCLHYIPAESYGSYPGDFEETFIWCDCFYQPETNLLAVEGCIWACPYDVIVLDFSHPMVAVEAAQWFAINENCRDDSSDWFDLEFAAWKGRTLVCKSLGEKPKGFHIDGKCDVEFV